MDCSEVAAPAIQRGAPASKPMAAAANACGSHHVNVVLTISEKKSFSEEELEFVLGWLQGKNSLIDSGLDQGLSHNGRRLGWELQCLS